MSFHRITADVRARVIYVREKRCAVESAFYAKFVAPCAAKARSGADRLREEETQEIGHA